MRLRIKGLLRRIVTLATSVALALGVFGISYVPNVSAACGGAQFTIYAAANGGGSSKTFCLNTNVPNLGNVQGTQWPECGVFHGGDWNDCASSARFIEFNVDTAVCLHGDPNYGGAGLRFWSDVGVFNLPSWIDNQGSSINWGNSCL